jgi:hypothetical protein
MEVTMDKKFKRHAELCSPCASFSSSVSQRRQKWLSMSLQPVPLTASIQSRRRFDEVAKTITRQINFMTQQGRYPDNAFCAKQEDFKPMQGSR